MSNTKPEWTPAEAMMFEFAIRRELITIRDRPFYGRYKGLLEQDEAIEWFVRWYGERAASFVIGHGPFEVGWRVIHAVFPVAAQECRDALSFRTLDEWLTALHNDRLIWRGPQEPDGRQFVEDVEAFRGAHARRFRKWPLQCRDCGDDFLPDRLRIVRCPSCRASRRRHEQQR
jgi:hypothetical protein